MATRYLTVRERALRAFENALKDITEANGYANTIKHVRRKRAIINKADDPPEIQLIFGESSTKKKSTEDRMTCLPITVKFFARRVTDNPDTEYNLLLGDIQRRLSQPVEDTSGATPREIQLSSDQSDVPLYWEGTEGDIVGLTEYELAFTWCNRDPRLWGANDSLVPA